MTAAKAAVIGEEILLYLKQWDLYKKVLLLFIYKKLLGKYVIRNAIFRAGCKLYDSGGISPIELDLLQSVQIVKVFKKKLDNS